MTKSILSIATAFALAQTAPAAFFAEEVLAFQPGTGQTNYLNPSAVLGKPGAIVGAAMFPNVFSLYSGHYEASELAQVSEGGFLTLRLSNYVSVIPGAPEIGVWENIFLFESQGVISGSDGADQAKVEVSADGQNWVRLNNDQPIVFGLPGSYYLNAGPYDAAAPANPQLADFGKPFLGSLNTFMGKTYSQAVDSLDGSAGGTWLDLDSTGLDRVGYIRFIGVPGSTLELNAVAINTEAAGSAVPEPGVGVALLSGLALLGTVRRRRA